MSMHHLDESSDDGAASIDGYRVDSGAEQVPNWLASCLDARLAEAVAVFLAERVESVAILKNLNVDEGSRGQGLGSAMLDGFLDRCGADAVLLVSDRFEIQQAGFDLDRFYMGRGFSPVVADESGPAAGRFLVWPESLAEEMAEHLVPVMAAAKPPAA